MGRTTIVCAPHVTFAANKRRPTLLQCLLLLFIYYEKLNKSLKELTFPALFVLEHTSDRDNKICTQQLYPVRFIQLDGFINTTHLPVQFGSLTTHQ